MVIHSNIRRPNVTNVWLIEVLQVIYVSPRKSARSGAGDKSLLKCRNRLRFGEGAGINIPNQNVLRKEFPIAG
jgi:hypothetical protein